MKYLRFLPLLAAAALLFGACSSDDTTVDPQLNSPSVLLKNLTLSAFVIDTDTVNVVPGQDKSPNDPVTLPLTVSVDVSGETEVASIECTVTLDGKTQVILARNLQARGAGVWSTDLPLSLRRGDVGDYRVEVNGLDKNGLPSNIAVSKLRVFYGSEPPVITEVLAPDTITVQLTTFNEVIAVRVTDPSGLGDIKQVFFNSFLPDGRPSSGNPFIMRDDGQFASGDATAGDGTYSLKISVPPTATKGTHRFEFRALDYSNLSSNVVIHTIVIR